MAKFIFYHSRRGQDVKRTLNHEKWKVNTEDRYIHTERGTDYIPSSREANLSPEPEAGVICFNIKTWGRAGWSS